MKSIEQYHRSLVSSCPARVAVMVALMITGKLYDEGDVQAARNKILENGGSLPLLALLRESKHGRRLIEQPFTSALKLGREPVYEAALVIILRELGGLSGMADLADDYLNRLLLAQEAGSELNDVKAIPEITKVSNDTLKKVIKAISEAMNGGGGDFKAQLVSVEVAEDGTYEMPEGLPPEVEAAIRETIKNGQNKAG